MENEKTQKVLLTDIISALKTHDIPYLLTGSFAVSYYGVPRATHDIDIVIESNEENCKNLLKALHDLPKGYSTTRSIAPDEQLPSLFVVFHAPTAVKIDLWVVSKEEFSGKFERKQSIRIDSFVVDLISPEDLIVNKLKWCKDVYSERHMEDCKGIIQFQKAVLDMTYMKTKVKQFGLETLFSQLTLR